MFLLLKQLAGMAGAAAAAQDEGQHRQLCHLLQLLYASSIMSGDANTLHQVGLYGCTPSWRCGSTIPSLVHGRQSL